MSATLIVVVTVTPVRFAVPIAVDAIAVLVSVGPMIVGPMGDDAAGYAHYHRERTQCSHPIKFIHSFVLLEIVARGNAGGHFEPATKENYILQRAAQPNTGDTGERLRANSGVVCALADEVVTSDVPQACIALSAMRADARCAARIRSGPIL